MRKQAFVLLCSALLLFCTGAVQTWHSKIVRKGPNPPTPDVSWLKFEEGTGTTVADATGNGRGGTLVNGPTWTTGCFSPYAVSLTHTSSHYITVTNLGAGINGTQGTLAFLVHLPSLPGAVTRYYVTVNGSTVHNPSVSNSEFFANKVYTLSTGSNAVASTTVLAANTWYHIAVSWAGTTHRLYVNGTQEGTTTKGTFTPSGNGVIGALWDLSAFHSFKISDFRAYSTERTATEIAAMARLRTGCN